MRPAYHSLCGGGGGRRRKEKERGGKEGRGEKSRRRRGGEKGKGEDWEKGRKRGEEVYKFFICSAAAKITSSNIFSLKRLVLVL